MEKIWLKHYPKDIPESIDPNQFRSLIELLDRSFTKYSDQKAYRCMGVDMGFSDLDRLSKHMASYFQNTCRLKPGDRVLIQLPNILQYPVVLFGALRAGLTVVNVNPLYTEREMLHQFRDSGAKTIVILENFAHKLETVLKDYPLNHIVVTGLGDLLGFPKGLLVNSIVRYIKKMVPSYRLETCHKFSEALKWGESQIFHPVDRQHEDIAFLQYTGGTTGVSKGAVLTHKNILANMLQISEWIRPLFTQKPGESETIITALPLYHIFSLTVNCLSFAYLGGCNLLVTNPRDIPGFIKLLKTEKYSVFAGINTLFNALMQHPEFDSIDFGQLKCSVAGGMALQETVAKEWKARTKTLIVEGYGLTESSPVVCCNPVDGTDKIGTIGMPVPSTEIKLIDPEGQEVPIGQAGELCLRGPQVMRGYWQNDSETQKVISDGWLRTGDVAMADSQGFFKIVDRIKDMILVSGFNVFPNEIEDVVMKHPAVSEVAAVGKDDGHSGEVVKIFVVKKTEVSADELISYCREQLVAYKVPKHVEFRTELPKTNVGKILRRALRDDG